MQAPTYDQYTEIDYEWGSHIPKHWKAIRFRFLLQDGYKGLKIGPFGSQIKLEELTNEGFKIYGQENVINRDFNLGNRYLNDSKFKELSVYEIKHGDLLITMMGTSGRCEICPDIEYPGIMDSHLIRLRVGEQITNRFARYLIDESDYVKSQIDLAGKGSIMHGLNSSIIKSLVFLVPPIEEQTQIAKFLDYKTTQIDRLIEKKKALIEKLGEQRIAVITQAVTKGLNPDVAMKDSEVDWLGEVPEHWEVKRLKFAIVFQRGHDLPADEREAGNVPLVSSAGISSSHSISKATAPGIVTGRYGTIGKFTYVEKDYWPLNTTLYSVDTVGNNVQYLWYMLHNLSDLFIINSKKSAVPGIDRNDLHPELTAIPPLEEQKAIVKYLNSEMEKIREMEELNRQTIEKLEEYRTALITAAVTGKIDVRNVDVPESGFGMLESRDKTAVPADFDVASLLKKP